MRILVVEDNKVVAENLDKGLQEEGYLVEVASEGNRALEMALQAGFDLVLLDRMMPGISGDEICQRMREAGAKVPILMLTAKADVGDRVQGLDLGADDYLTKPFAFAELLARVRALLRRGEGGPAAPVLKLEDLELDPAAHTVTRAGRQVALSAREYALLEYLLRNAGVVVTRDEIAQHVWGHPVTSNAIEVYLSYVRRKVDRDHDVKLIHNVRGVGYVMRKEE